MDYKQISVYEVLRIEDVELFETFKDSGLLITRGDLLLLYNPKYNWFILKINDFNYGLNKKIPLLASSREFGASRAYVLPTKESYLVIRIPIASDADLNRLEDFLRNNSDFAYKEGARGEGLPIELGEGTVRIKKIPADKPDKRSWSVSQLINYGGQKVHNLMISSAESIAGGITRVGNSIETSYIPKETETPMAAKTISRIAIVNSAVGMNSNMSTFYIKGLMDLGKSIAQKIAQYFEKQEFDKEVEEIREKEAERQREKVPEPPEGGNIISASLHSVMLIWQGLVGALDIIGAGIGDTTSHIVAQKYGPLAGEIFKAGVGAVGKTVRVPNIPGQKYLRYVNRYQSTINTYQTTLNRAQDNINRFQNIRGYIAGQ